MMWPWSKKKLKSIVVEQKPIDDIQAALDNAAERAAEEEVQSRTMRAWGTVSGKHVVVTLTIGEAWHYTELGSYSNPCWEGIITVNKKVTGRYTFEFDKYDRVQRLAKFDEARAWFKEQVSRYPELQSPGWDEVKHSV